MATHSSILAWEIPWMEGPDGLQSTGSQSLTRLSDFTGFLFFYKVLTFLAVNFFFTIKIFKNQTFM